MPHPLRAIAFFRSLTANARLRRGTVAGYTALVRGLAFHIAGHELHHLGVIKERYLSFPRAAAMRGRLALCNSMQAVGVTGH